MPAQPLSFDDLQERLQELGGAATKKTGKAVMSGLTGAIDKTFELLTGSTSTSKEKAGRQNHDPIPQHLIDQSNEYQDQKQLAKVRSQLTQLQSGGNKPTNDRVEFNSFFRRYNEQTESFQQKLKREREEEKQREEYEELERKKREEEERAMATSGGAPQGKIRKSIFGKVKKRATMIETKASSGKQ